MEIVSLQKGESLLCKNLRLRALQDAPLAFAETYEAAVSQDERYWQLVYESLVAPSAQRMFIARSQGLEVGSVYALLDQNDSSVGRVGGMWIDSGYRQKGFGEGLFESVKVWAKDLGFEQIRLWVEDNEHGAKKFYSRLGFRATGLKDETQQKINKPICEMSFSLNEK